MTDRDEVGEADVDLYTEPGEVTETEGGYSMVLPGDGYRHDDLGRLVLDRIEANGIVTLPDADDRPDEGERVYLGRVWWDDRGIPTRLERASGETIVFTADGGVDEVVDDD